MKACPKCGSVQLTPRQDECQHRRACEARQMLRDGASYAEAAAHAQRLRPEGADA